MLIGVSVRVFLCGVLVTIPSQKFANSNQNCLLILNFCSIIKVGNNCASPALKSVQNLTLHHLMQPYNIHKLAYHESKGKPMSALEEQIAFLKTVGIELNPNVTIDDLLKAGLSDNEPDAYQFTLSLRR